MNLTEYVAVERGRTARLAALIGVHPVLVTQWSRKTRRVPAERCPAIERATDGAVRCEELRPDIDWAVLREQVAPHLEAA